MTDGNAYYQDIDGVLFNADATQLITYPAGREGAYEIPGTVTDIAYLAFGWCKKLTAVVLPASVAQIEGHAFQQCSLIEEIVIPEGVQELGEFTFSGCTRLAGIHIPNSVTAFGQSLFANCSSLVIRSRRNAPARAYAEANGLAWSPILQNVLTLPEDLTVIESEAFTGIPQTDAVRLGDNVTTIANDAFDGDMVFLATPGTPAALWAEQHGFLVIPEE